MISLKFRLRSLTTGLVLAFAGIFPLSVFAQTPLALPFETDFEVEDGYNVGLLAVDSWWQLETGLDVDIVVPGAASLQALSFSGGEALSLFTDSGGASVSWVDFYLKPVFVNVEELPVIIESEQSAVAGFVKASPVGEIYAIDGDGVGGGEWRPSNVLKNLSGERAIDWIRLTYRLDYTSKKWDLFVDGTMVMADLGFLDVSDEALSSFSIISDSNTDTLLDYFYAGNNNPLFLDTSNDGLPDSWLIANGLDVNVFQRYRDVDHDGLDNIDEYQLLTNPIEPDTDSDGLHDGIETLNGANPIVSNTYPLNFLPFEESFEIYSNMMDGFSDRWISSGEDISIASGDAAEGEYSLLIGSAESVNAIIQGQTHPIVWVDFYIKPTLAKDVPELTPNSSVVFYFNEEAYPVVFDGINSAGAGFWRSYEVPLADSEWNRITLKLDYDSKQFDFYFDSERLAEQLGFAFAQPYFNQFSIKGDSALDGIQFSVNEPSSLDNDGDGLLNSLEDANSNGLVDAGESDPNQHDTNNDGRSDYDEIVGNYDSLTELERTELANASFSWTTSFEFAEGYINGALHGQAGWYTAPTGVNVTTVDDQNHLTLSTVSNVGGLPVLAAKYFNQSDVDNVWVSFHAQLSSSDSFEIEELEGDLPAIVALRVGSTVRGWDGETNEWVNSVLASPEDWHDYSIFINFQEATWNLYVDGLPMLIGLGFANENITNLSEIKLLQRGGLDSLFDDFSVSSLEPETIDEDGDGLVNHLERDIGTDLYLADTDGDGFSDFEEYYAGLDPNDANDLLLDGDNDGLSNLQELVLGYDPHNADENEDGYLDGVSVPGFVTVEKWYIHSGTNQGFSTNSFLGKSQADAFSSIDSLYEELTLDPAAEWNGLGRRVRGYFVPNETDTYYFRVFSDRRCEFYLSPDDNAFNKELVALDSGILPVTRSSRTGQDSFPVSLEAGRKYYFEFIYSMDYTSVEGVWGVSWAKGSRDDFSIVSGVNLMSYPPNEFDTDDDGLADAFEIEHGLDHFDALGNQGAWGNLDADSYWNGLEQAYGLSPVSQDAIIIPSFEELFPEESGDLIDFSQWTFAELGNASDSQFFELANGELLMATRSSQFGTIADHYAFAYQTVTGDFDLVCRVEFESLYDPKAFAGLVVAKGLSNTGSRYALVEGPDRRLHSYKRAYDDKKGSFDYEDIAFSSDGQWLRVIRVGSQVRFYRSFDGSRWFLHDELEHAYSGDLNVGFAFSSANIRQYESVKFRDISLLSGDDVVFDEDIEDINSFIDSEDEAEGNQGQGSPESGITASSPENWSNIQTVSNQLYELIKGRWFFNSDGYLEVRDLNGKLKVPFNLDQAGIYKLQIPVAYYYTNERNADRFIDIHQSVDGQFLASSSYVVEEDGGLEVISIVLPYLGAGEHSYEIDWENVYEYRWIGLGDLSIEEPVFATEELRQVWEQDRITETDTVNLLLHYIDDQGALSVPVGAQGELLTLSNLNGHNGNGSSAGNNSNLDTYVSFVSPAFVEGTSAYRKFVTAESQPVEFSEGNGWFTDLELDEDGDKDVFAMSLQNGGLTYDFEVRWGAVNVLSGGEITVRQGDALRLIAGDQENGNPTTISIEDTTYITTGKKPVIHQFDQAGSYTVTGSIKNETGTISVEVIANVSFDDLAVARGKTRQFIWDYPYSLHVGDLQMLLNSDSTSSYSLRRSEAQQERYFTSRISGPLSPYHSVVRTDPFWLRENVEGYFQLDELEVGISLATHKIVASDLPSDVEIQIEVFRAGVMFEDGSIEAWVSSDDFDEFGQYNYNLLVPEDANGSACHHVNLYENGEFINRR